MNYAAIYEYDTVNSISGFSVSLFVSGCGKVPKCRMCQNSKAWNFNYGKLFTPETKEQILNMLSKDYIKSFCLLGGEPSDNLSDGALVDLLLSIKERYPNKKIYCWTGYLYEDLMQDELKSKFIKLIDILIDGEFIPELKNLNRPLANSTNQRILDIRKTIETGNIVHCFNE